MTSDWYSLEMLRNAWKYAKIDMRDDFVFDIIEYQDVKSNIDSVFQVLNTQLEQDQYYPAPLISIPVPKSDHSVRPGTVIPPIDLIVLYAIAQQLAPPLDAALAECAYAYRLNPRREDRSQPLFTDRESPEDATEVDQDGQAAEVGFPYNWFDNWIRFDQDTQSASRAFEHVAVTDITAFFENISLRILFDRMREILGEEYRELLDRLRVLLDYWDWAVSAEKTSGTGLPQGNDVSSFMSNIYLRDLDRAILSVVVDDEEKYYRYVDDIRVYTSNRSEARRALVEMEHTLRTLGLNVQTAKTEIRLASETVDPDVAEWMQRLSNESEDRAEWARSFIAEVFEPVEPDSMKKWPRVYRRSLTVLGQANDDTAVPVAFDMFLSDPSVKQLRKNFRYLRRFTSQYPLEEEIHDTLTQEDFKFDYHRAYLYRLAAHSRGQHSALKELALQEATDSSSHWFARVGALLFLSTCRLSPSGLGQVSAIVNEGNTQVVRAAYVTLSQHSGDELRWVLDNISYVSAPHQDYLRRYFFRLARSDELGDHLLSVIDRMAIENPFMIRHLHQLDLIKANQSLRPRFREVLEEKLDSCGEEWPRLRSRLEGIYDAFIENP